jgi:NADPH2:quinone reductase
VKAILCTRFGTPDDLVLADIPEPTPAPGEVVAKVVAVGLNFFDTLIIAGKYQKKPSFPFSPCGEFTGVVERIGEGVTGFAPGDRVLGYCTFGAARERIAVGPDKLVKLTVDLDLVRAAGLAITYGTSYHALTDRAHLKSGETLAVLGAAGGVGLAAVELGKLMGARVIACASSAEKLAFAKQHGADDVIDYSQGNLRDALRAATGGKGADIVYDPVGGPYSEPAVRGLNWGGRLLVVGFAAGEIPKIPLNLTLLKNCDIRGVFWGEWTRRNPEAHRANMRELMDWAASGKISAHIHKVYPLAETTQAMKAITSRAVMGKIVLKP